MKLMLDGRRLDDHLVDTLLFIAGHTAMNATLTSLGFHRKPVRAPKGLRNGDLVLRFAWEKREGNMRAVIRSIIALEAAGLV